MLQNQSFVTACTYIGFATEEKNEFDEMVANDEYNHIVFTDRGQKPDMEFIKGTHKILQVKSVKGSTVDNHWLFRSSHLPCSCVNFLQSCSSETCLYEEVRNIEEQHVSDKNDNSISDPYGLQKLTIRLLKLKLSERGLLVNGS